MGFSKMEQSHAYLQKTLKYESPHLVRGNVGRLHLALPNYLLMPTVYSRVVTKRAEHEAVQYKF